MGSAVPEDEDDEDDVIGGPPIGVTRRGTGCSICGSETTACAVRCISKLTGFGPGDEMFEDVGDSGNFVHCLLDVDQSLSTCCDCMGELSSELFGINVVVLLALLVLEIIVEVGLILTAKGNQINIFIKKTIKMQFTLIRINSTSVTY